MHYSLACAQNIDGREQKIKPDGGKLQGRRCRRLQLHNIFDQIVEDVPTYLCAEWCILDVRPDAAAPKFAVTSLMKEKEERNS